MNSDVHRPQLYTLGSARSSYGETKVYEYLGLHCLTYLLVFAI